MVQFRKSKNFGPFRLNISQRGISTSFGAGPVRVTRSANGTVRRTVRAPGTGLYDTKVVGGRKGRPQRSGSVRAQRADFVEAQPTAPELTLPRKLLLVAAVVLCGLLVLGLTIGGVAFLFNRDLRVMGGPFLFLALLSWLGMRRANAALRGRR